MALRVTESTGSPPVRDGRVVLRDVLRGAGRSVPLALSDAAYGVLFGVLARRAGLSLPEALAMSALVYAGSAQFIALGMWVNPLPVLSLTLTSLVVNLRYLLMGATLGSWLATLSPVTRYGSLFLLTDESWALSLATYERQESGGGFLIGSGVVLYTGWIGGTAVGAAVGAMIENPMNWGFDFAFTALFAALLAGRYTGRRDLLPWAAAAGVAVATAALLPGTWYILLGALAGTAVGMVRDAI